MSDEKMYTVVEHVHTPWGYKLHSKPVRSFNKLWKAKLFKWWTWDDRLWTHYTIEEQTRTDAKKVG